METTRERSLTVPPGQTTDTDPVLRAEDSEEGLFGTGSEDERQTNPKEPFNEQREDQSPNVDTNELLLLDDEHLPPTRAAAFREANEKRMEELVSRKTATIGEVNLLITCMGNSIIDKLQKFFGNEEQTTRADFTNFVHHVQEELRDRINQIIRRGDESDAVISSLIARQAVMEQDYKNVRQLYDKLEEEFTGLLNDLTAQSRDPPPQTPFQPKRALSGPSAPVKNLGLDTPAEQAKTGSAQRLRPMHGMSQQPKITPNSQQKSSCIPDITAMLVEANLKQASMAAATAVVAEPLSSERNWDRFKYLIKHLPQYSGFPNEQFDKFETIISNFVTTHALSDADARLTVRSCLRKDSVAYSWMENEEQRLIIEKIPSRDFKGWMKALRTKFGVHEQDRDQRARDMKQQPDESADEYFDKKFLALRQAGITSKSTILRALERGVLDRYRAHITMNRTFFEEEEDLTRAVKKMKGLLKGKMESCKDDTMYQHLGAAAAMPAGPDSTSIPAEVMERVIRSLEQKMDARFENLESIRKAEQSQRPFLGKCHNCDQVGHFARNCTLPQRRNSFSGRNDRRSYPNSMRDSNSQPRSSGYQSRGSPSIQSGNETPVDRHARSPGNFSNA